MRKITMKSLFVEPKKAESVEATVETPTSWGLTGIAETRKQDSSD